MSHRPDRTRAIGADVGSLSTPEGGIHEHATEGLLVVQVRALGAIPRDLPESAAAQTLVKSSDPILTFASFLGRHVFESQNQNIDPTGALDLDLRMLGLQE